MQSDEESEGPSVRSRDSHWPLVISLLLVAGLVLAGLALGIGAQLSFWDAVFIPFQMALLNYTDPGFRPPASPAPEAWEACHEVLCYCWTWQGVFIFARLWIPLCFGSAVVWGYLALLGRPVNRYWLWASSFWRRPVVICGGGNQGRVLAREHLARDHRVIVIALDAGELEEARVAGLTIVNGDAASPVLLRNFGVPQARAIYVVAGKDETNIRVLRAVEQAKRQSRLGKFFDSVCLVQIFDSFLSGALADTLNTDRSGSRTTLRLEIRFFNSWKQSARVLIATHGPDIVPGSKLTSTVRDSSAEQPHVLLIGYTWTAQHLVEQLARLGQFAHDKKVRITLVAPDGSAIRSRLHAEFPAMDRASPDESLPREIAPVVDLRVIDTPLDGLPTAVIRTSPRISVAYVTTEDPESGFSAIHSLLRQAPELTFPIVLCTQSRVDEFQFLQQHPRVKIFDALECGLELESNEPVLNEFGEREAALVNYYFAHKGKGSLLSFADMARRLRSPDLPKAGNWRDAMNDWFILEEWARESNRDAVGHLIIKQRYAGSEDLGGLDKEKKEVLSRMEHQRWCAERLLLGWRYGEETDRTRKLHRDLKPFDQLDDEEKLKDEDIINISGLILRSRAKT